MRVLSNFWWLTSSTQMFYRSCIEVALRVERENKSYNFRQFPCSTSYNFFFYMECDMDAFHYSYLHIILCSIYLLKIFTMYVNPAFWHKTTCDVLGISRENFSDQISFPTQTIAFFMLKKFLGPDENRIGSVWVLGWCMVCLISSVCKFIKISKVVINI